jgi:hypothetical protein
MNVMDKQHRQIVTTYPVAIKSGQKRVHVRNPYPWHANSEDVNCPKCGTAFIVTQGFPKAQLLEALEAQDKNHQEHPDFIPSEPNWTSLTDCDCELEHVSVTWKKDKFTYTEDGVVGRGFIYNCKIERGDVTQTAPTIHSTRQLKREEAEAKFADWRDQKEKGN